MILKAFSKYLSKSGLSAKMVQQHTANIEMFANKYLIDFDPPRLLLDIDFVHLVIQNSPNVKPIVTYQST